jgi:hypothetical protein
VLPAAVLLLFPVHTSLSTCFASDSQSKHMLPLIWPTHRQLAPRLTQHALVQSHVLNQLAQVCF